MGAHQNPLQGAVVLAVAVVSAGLNGALNALVGMTVHLFFLLFTEFAFSMGIKTGNMLEKFRSVAFPGGM